MTKVAVVLSGCGHLDGAEIRESVLSLLYLDRQGVEVQVFAPDQMQHGVVNHLTGAAVDEKRNMLVEAARIARGKVRPLAQARAQDFDALVMPGGFGAAKNLSDFAFKGVQAAVLPELKNLIYDFYAQKKPIAAICIAPVLLAAALGAGVAPIVTIGDDAGVASAIASLGGKHQDCATIDCVVDEQNLLVTCPAYMRDDRLSDIAQGIERAMHEVVRMAKARAKRAA